MRGKLEADLSTELGSLTVDSQRAETVLHGEIPDQAALHGVLDLLQEHGLDLLEVRRLPDQANRAAPSGSAARTPMVMSAAEQPPARERLKRARESATRAALWAEANVPGGTLATAALERERLSAAGLLAGGLAYRLFFWLVPLGLVLAAALSFWVDGSGSASVEDAAREFGLSGAAAQSAAAAIEREAYARWYFLVIGLALLFWFGIGVLRALNVAHAIAWRLRPEKLAHPARAGVVFTGCTVLVVGISAAAAWVRQEEAGPGIGLTIALVLLYVAVAVWLMDKLPHRGRVLARPPARCGAPRGGRPAPAPRGRLLHRAAARSFVRALRDTRRRDGRSSSGSISSLA